MYNKGSFKIVVPVYIHVQGKQKNAFKIVGIATDRNDIPGVSVGGGDKTQYSV